MHANIAFKRCVLHCCSLVQIRFAGDITKGLQTVSKFCDKAMTISVTQLNNYIHGVLDIDGVLNDLSVCGEITNVKASRDGWYFSLKDESAAIDCFCYGNAAEPVSGMMAVAEGKVNFWTKSGRISLFVRRLTASKNTGAAYLQFLQLKEKLQKEGLFDQERKKEVPVFCKKIGVVTSATGAVIHDIVNVVRRRQPFSDVVLCPVKVQGVGADVEIAQGIRRISQTDVDVVIVGRGGGSNEDLSMFNSEIVVRAVADCCKPVVSAVGHGVDFTLCDFAADKRAVTPSEAAEFVTTDCVPLKKNIYARLSRLSSVIARRLVEQKTLTLHSVKSIAGQLERQIEQNKIQIKYVLKSQRVLLDNLISDRNSAMKNVVARISAANPVNVLKRGYAMLKCKNERVCSVQQVQEGQKLTAVLADGEVETTVLKVKK